MEYVESDGESPFGRWLRRQPAGLSAHFDQRILVMEAMPFWPEKWASDYKGAEGILELRVPFNKVQYRPLGMHAGTGRRVFVLLGGAIEKGGNLPKGDVQAVQQRRKVLLEEPGRVRPFNFEA